MINSKVTRIEKFYNLPIISFSNHYLGLLSFLLTAGGSLGGQIHVRVRSTSEPLNLKPNLDHNTELVFQFTVFQLGWEMGRVQKKLGTT